MRKSFCVLVLIPILFSLCACQIIKPSTNQHGEYDPQKTSVSKDCVSEFMALLGDSKADEAQCYNVTPPEVSAKTDMKIFKFSDSSRSYVLLNNEIYTLCESFGGLGFVNAIPCDFDNDGNNDLLVASSWGSGLHRAVISVFNSVTKESTILYEKENADLIVARTTANMFTDEPQNGNFLYFSVLSVTITIENNNWPELSYVVNDIEGSIQTENNLPKFVPYPKKY